MISSIFIGGSIIVFAVITIFLVSCYKRIKKSGEALIITRYGNNKKEAVLNGAFVWPMINIVETIDVTKRSIEIVREGQKGKSGEEYEGLPCKDNIRANLKVVFFIGVNPDPKDLLLIAENFTCEGASDINVLEKYLSPKFSEALKTAIKKFDFVELYESRIQFRDEVKKLLENDMDGFKLYDVVIDKIEQTPLDAHDPHNVLDSDGIRKISEMTAQRNIETAQIRQHEETETKKRTVDGETSRLQLNKKLAEETAKTNREIEHIRIEENKNIQIQKESANLITEQVRIENEQKISIIEENKIREVEVARINNEKVVEVQREQVNRAQEVEKVLTAREVAERNIEKDKVVEVGKRDVAVTIAERTKTEREIAFEEEQTKDIRVKSNVEREKLVVVTGSKATAEAEAIKVVTFSEAELNAAKNDVQRQTLIADNQLVVSNKNAEAQERLANANRVSKAAEGLAEVDVRDKMADVHKKEAEVEAGKVRAIGLAEVEVKSQDAGAIEKLGKAEAIRIKEIGLAEAEGAEAKYKAMDSIQPEVRKHELDKLNIERDKEVQLSRIEMEAKVAVSNAEVMAQAMAKANIKVIGGDTMFDSIRNSIISSTSIDERFKSSEILNGMFEPYVTGKKDIVSDIKDVLQKSDVSTGNVGDLALAHGVVSLLKNTPKGQSFIDAFLNGKQ